MIAQEGRCFLLLQLQQCLDIGAITTSVWPRKKRTFPIPRVHFPAQRGLDHLPRDPSQLPEPLRWRLFSAVYRQSRTVKTLLALQGGVIFVLSW